jgi:CubicO group peptidase (beta-lactamase class C family)
MALTDVTRPEEAGLSAAGLDGVDAGLQAEIAKGDLVGAVTLVARHGKVARRSVLGFDSLEKKTRLRTDTIFRIFSMTKPVTAVAMMILHDKGFWKPDDPVGKFIPAFNHCTVFEGLDDAEQPVTMKADHPPTLRELLTHTAGLTYGRSDALHDRPYKDANIWGAPTLMEFAERIGRVPLAYQPGTQWLYSLSMDVQGAIIEAITGQSLADFMQEHIFGPLKMVDTAFWVPPEKAGRLAHSMYLTSRKGGLHELDKSPMGNDYLKPPKLAGGGGGLVSTLDDYARFAQMLLNRGELDGVRVLSPQAVALMSANHLPDWMLEAGFGIGAMQIRRGFGYGFNGAVFTDPKAAGIPVGQGTYEWDGAAGTWFWVDWANDLIFIGMIQRFAVTEGVANAQQLTQKLLAAAILP